MENQFGDNEESFNEESLNLGTEEKLDRINVNIEEKN